jgi:hypothetical protein
MTEKSLDTLVAEHPVPPQHRYYFNGFLATIGPADISVILLQNNEPTALILGSHTAVKTVAKALLEIIEQFEKATDNPIKTVDDLNRALTAKKT